MINEHGKYRIRICFFEDYSCEEWEFSDSRHGFSHFYHRADGPALTNHPYRMEGNAVQILYGNVISDPSVRKGYAHMSYRDFIQNKIVYKGFP